MLKLFNTLSKQQETLESQSDTLTMYTCGPTVYDHAHIGNMRSYLFADLIYRTLKLNGQKVRWVMNLTDIDDKTIKGAIKEYGSGATVENLKDYTSKFSQIFFDDLKKINVSQSEIEFINVTDVIPQIQEFIIKLKEKGYAYTAEDRTTYFSIQKYQEDFGDYGQLVGAKFLEGKKIGARVKVDEYDKDNLSDFALWKAWDEQDAQIFWDHPELGKGRPGWHIECSVINNVAFGDSTTDLHTGGIDLIFPHHTNEIAQSQPMYKPFVNVWAHGEFLMVDNKKMAKSEQNFTTISNIEDQGFSGLDFRYLMLQSNYGKQTNFTWDALASAKTAREKLHQWALAMDEINEQEDLKFTEIINNNLNSAEALAHAWENKENLKFYDQVLGLNLFQPIEKTAIPEEIQQLLNERQTARDNKDYAKSDELRDKIKQLGFEVKDTPSGQTVNKI